MSTGPKAFQTGRKEKAYVILRDDDTNALTKVEHLDRLYRPFLERGLPVNLAVIPNVRTDITYGQNILEGFLFARGGTTQHSVPVGQNMELVQYLLGNPGYHVVQHGYNHEFVHGDCEFEQHQRAEVQRRLEQGRRCLTEAGLGAPATFVAPYDRFTRSSIREVARSFRVISGSWFEWRRLPVTWWPRFLLKKMARRNHWRVGQTILLSHPPCYLSYRRSYATMLKEIKRDLATRRLTVLVTHWWEFFHTGGPDVAFIQILHELAEYLADNDEIETVSFQDVAEGRVPLK